MTLILSCITQDAAVQVVDRRLIGSDGTVYDDASNKMTLFDGRLAFGYTGLAYLNGQRTDRWLEKLLNRPECSSADKAIQLLKTTATTTLRGITLPTQYKRLAFVGVGWSISAEHKRPMPLICRVSNFHGDGGGVLAHASEELRADVSSLRRNQPFALIATGQSLPVAVAAKYRWLLRHHVKEKARYSTLLDVLVRCARECAENNRAVGRSLLSAVIPRQAVSHEMPFIATKDGSPAADIVSFRTWPDGNAFGDVYHPNYAGQRPVLSNFEHGTLGSGTISIDDRSFTITYPCFYFTNEARTVLLTSHSRGMKCLSVYTEREVAEAMQVVGGVRTVLRMIESPGHFAVLLGSLKDDFEGVFFNPTVKGKCCSVTVHAMMRALTSE